MTDSLGRILVAAGVFLAAVGGLIWLGGRFLPLGRLPGDILIRRESFTFYFPLTTAIVISVILTLILNLIQRLR